MPSKKQNEFLSQDHTLLKPIGNRKKVVVTPYTVAASKDFQPTEKTLTTKDKVKLVALTSDLKSDELMKLSTPDFNAIFWKAYDYYIKTGYELAGVEQSSQDDAVTLFFENRQSLSPSMPVLQHLIDSEAYEDEFDRTIFIMEQVTGLSASEIDELKYPDFLSLNEMVSAFLYQTADFFQ